LLFTALAEAPDTEDWIALHSLRLAKHRSQQRGEADFVVIAPGHGMAVIEVKSHLSVARDRAGRWLLGRSAPTTRSPFEQADAAKFAISEYLSRTLGMTAVHIEACVWFTHVPARRDLPASIEWPAFQLLDESDLSQGPAVTLARVIAAGRAHRAAAGHTWPDIVGPDAAQARAIASALRPSLLAEPAPADVRRARDTELVQLLDEQLEVFDGLLDNPRVLVTGPAGCGKTFLALAAAREEAQAGRRGLLLCFNHALSVELARAAREVPGLIVRTLASTMLEASGLAPRPDTDREFWEQTLPVAAWEALVEGAEDPADYLIVDEVQDLCLPAYLDVIDLLVQGSLAGGRCLLFGDFDDQVIYAGVGDRRVPLSRLGSPTTFAMRTNCRNTRAIADQAIAFGGGAGRYRRCRRSSDGTAPKVRRYKDAAEQEQELVAAVRQARDAGFDLAEIVVLSRYRKSAAALCHDPWLAPLLVDYRRGGPVAAGRVRYSTIHSFKGLEAPAVILTDVNEASHGPYNELVAVGITRARDWLTVLATSEGLAQLRVPAS
ncbi:MAG: hypothetical protein QG597_2747, partial [Actinomycetota bacterium]|nr:hypothetical protein [Actinomycetota bacterium]